MFSFLADAGSVVEDFDLPQPLDTAARIQDRINFFESCQALSFERDQFPELISEDLRLRLSWGERVSVDEYQQAMRVADACRRQMDELFDDHDLLIAPSAPGEAPKSLDDTGDPIFGKVWTLLHTPALSMPFATGPRGLPLGMQLIARRWNDDHLLRCAEWIAQYFDPSEQLSAS